MTRPLQIEFEDVVYHLTSRGNARQDIFLDGSFPINVLPAIKAIPEVCHIICATANPVQVIVAEIEQGCGILGVIDGVSPKGVETDSEKRKEFLRTIGYKL